MLLEIQQLQQYQHSNNTNGNINQVSSDATTIIAAAAVINEESHFPIQQQQQKQQNETQISSLLTTKLSEYEEVIKSLHIQIQELETSKTSYFEEKRVLEGSLQEKSSEIILLKQNNYNRDVLEKEHREFKEKCELLSTQFNIIKQQANK